MATDDSLVRERPKSTLLANLGKARTPQPEIEDTRAEAPDGDTLIPLPQPGSAYDAAHARPANKPVPSLRFVMGDTVRGFSYANLDTADLVAADKPGGSPMIVLRFSGIVAREARLTGRHLFLLYDLITDHRVAWVRELPKGRDFADATATVITGVVIERIKEMPA